MARTSDCPVKFVLRDPAATKPTPINCIARFNNQRVNFGTGKRVLPDHWNAKKERIKNVVDATDKDEVNRILDGIEEIVMSLKNSGQLTKEMLKSRVDTFLSPPADTPKLKEPTEPALFTFIDEFIKAAPTRINPTTNKPVGEKTIKKYNTTIKVLREFADIYKRPIDFKTIDLDFYEAFTSYLTIQKNFTVNNVGKYIATLIVFLGDADYRGHPVNKEYKSKRFKVLKEDADNIYLSEAELQLLHGLDLSRMPRLDRIRDLFLVGCYTGLRFSDFSVIRPENIQNGFIRIEQFKTQGKVVIPCHSIVSAILVKYEGKIPRAISNQKMNDYLKELCHFAGMTGKTTKGQTKGGKRIITTHEKWEIVSTHTVRRSFATNAYLMGVPSITIMRITGHKTEKAFLNYIKLDAEQHAKVMALHWEKAEAAPIRRAGVFSIAS